MVSKLHSWDTSVSSYRSPLSLCAHGTSRHTGVLSVRERKPVLHQGTPRWNECPEAIGGEEARKKWGLTYPIQPTECTTCCFPFFKICPFKQPPTSDWLMFPAHRTTVRRWIGGRQSLNDLATVLVLWWATISLRMTATSIRVSATSARVAVDCCLSSATLWSIASASALPQKLISRGG